MEITSGKIAGAQKIVLYGPEGIGKSTFAAQFPSPLFIDTEGSTKHLDVKRLPVPGSWTMLMQEVTWVRDNPNSCGTLVIDTADWAEKLCSQHVCATKLVSKQGEAAKSIEDFGYGKGYTYLMEEFGRLLNLLSQVCEQGIHVLLTAHAKMRKFEQPDELGAYDRWELKLEKTVAPMVKEWSDMLLFANYKTYVVNVDGQGAAKGKNKAQGGTRVMFTTHHPAWDAKNRAGLPEELPLHFSAIAEHIPGGVCKALVKEDKPKAEAAAIAPAIAPEIVNQHFEAVADQAIAQLESLENRGKEEPAPASTATSTRPEGIPDSLWQLMQQNGVTEEQLRYAVFKRGYYPYETPIGNYDESFIKGVLIGAWPQVYQLVLQTKDEMPF